MGQPKESLPILGTTLLGRIAAALGAGLGPVVVVARPGQALPQLPAGVEVAHDEWPDQGPLAGLASGLRHLQRRGGAAADLVFATGTDLPFASAAVAQWLAAQVGSAAAAVPHVDGRWHPLCGVYRLGVVTNAEALLGAGERALHRLCTAVAARPVAAEALATVDPDLRCLRNVNTPADLAALHAALAAMPPSNPPPPGAGGR